MAAFSNYLEDQITGWIQGSSFASALTGGTFVQLFSNAVDDAGTGTAIFARASVASGAGSWTRGTDGSGTITNATAITITASATAAATACSVGVYDASADGHLLFHGVLTAAKTIASGDEVKFNASALTLTVA